MLYCTIGGEKAPYPEDMLTEYREARTRAPYSARAIEALDSLIEYGRDKHDWRLLIDVVRNELKFVIIRSTSMLVAAVDVLLLDFAELSTIGL